MTDTPIPLPPPTFEFLVFSLKMQAEMRLGMHAFAQSEDEKEEPDLSSARHAIDMLAMIADKTKGNLSIEEQRLIENALTELRFRFVQVSEEKGKQKAAQAVSEDPASSEAPASS